jgi:lipopolysaccharide transport system permease protein
MVGVVEGFRWALLGTKMTLGPMLFVSASASIILLISGIYYFRRLERTFADVI